NSGRLSVPSFFVDSALNTPDEDEFTGSMLPGAPMDDAPISCASGASWLLHALGNRFQLLHYVEDAATLDAATAKALASLADAPIPIEALVVAQRGTAAAGLTTLIDNC